MDNLLFVSNESILPKEMNNLNILFQINNYVKWWLLFWRALVNELMANWKEKWFALSWKYKFWYQTMHIVQITLTVVLKSLVSLALSWQQPYCHPDKKEIHQEHNRN